MGVPKKFKCCTIRCAKVTFPEMIVLKENTNLKLFVDDEDQLPATAAGNVFTLDNSYHHPSTFTIQ